MPRKSLSCNLLTKIREYTIRCLHYVTIDAIDKQQKLWRVILRCWLKCVINIG